MAAITILTLTVFLLLEGRGMFERGTGRLPDEHRDRFRRVGTRIAAGALLRQRQPARRRGRRAFYLRLLEITGFHLAVPLAVLVGFLDLIPLIGLTGAALRSAAVLVAAVLVGANLAGVLGALIAIPTAASLGVLIDELVLPGPAGSPQPEPAE